MKNTCWVKMGSQPRHPVPICLHRDRNLFSCSKCAHRRQKKRRRLCPPRGAALLSAPIAPSPRMQRRAALAAPPRPTLRASARSQRWIQTWHLPPHPPPASHRGRGQPTFWEPPARLVEVAAPSPQPDAVVPPPPHQVPGSGGSFSLCKRERGAGTRVCPAGIRETGMRGSVGNSVAAQERGKAQEMPNFEGEKAP